MVLETIFNCEAYEFIHLHYWNLKQTLRNAAAKNSSYCPLLPSGTQKHVNYYVIKILSFLYMTVVIMT